MNPTADNKYVLACPYGSSDLPVYKEVAQSLLSVLP